MSDAETFEDALSDADTPAMNGHVNGDLSSDDAAKKRKKREWVQEHPMRVSDRENKGMASTTFLAEWLSTHYEPKDDTEGEVASKVYDLYFNDCVRRQDAALDYHEFVAGTLKVFPTVSKEMLVPAGRKTKKQMFTGLMMRPESPLYSLTNKSKKTEDGEKEKKPGLNLKELEEKVIASLKELKKPGGVGIARLKRFFTENHPDYHIDRKTYLLINALERLASYGKIVHEKGVGACAYYSPVKTQEEIDAEKEEAEKKAQEAEEEKKDDGEEGAEGEEKKVEEEKDFEVEKILNRKKSRGEWLYLVRWAGFGESEDTWEPIENLKGSEEIMEECTKEILKAEKRDKIARQKAWKAKQKASAAKAWEPSKRGVIDHLPFVLTACTDPYAASVGQVKKYILQHYAEFDVANKLQKFKNALERLTETGKASYLTGKGLSGNLAITADGMATLSRASANTLDNAVLEACVAMAEPKGAAMSKIRKYYGEHLPSLKTNERPKNFKKSIEAAVKKGLLYQVSGLGLTGSYQLMEPYTPPPVTVRRILKAEVFNDGEYSDIEVKESEDEVESEDEPTYKPRGSTKSGRKVTVASKRQAPVVAPKAKAAGVKRKAAPAKSKYVDESSDEEVEESSEEEAEEPPKKRGKQTPAKRGKPAAAKKAPVAAKKAAAKKAPAAAKKAPAASPRGGRGGAGGGREAAKRSPAKKPVYTAEDSESEEESIASDFEDHPPPIRGGKSARGKAVASKAAKSPSKSPAKSPPKPPVNKAAKKAVPVAVGRGPGGRAARAKPMFYGTPSPEYDESDASEAEPPKVKKTPVKKSPAKRGGAAAGRGRGGKTPVKAAPPPSDSEPESDKSEAAPPPAKGRGRGGATPKKAPAKKAPAKKAPAKKKGAAKRKRAESDSSD